jgi:hypothetical protein
MDGEDEVGAYVRWTDERRDWDHDSVEHVDLGCEQKIGVREKLWTPVLAASDDVFLLGACGNGSHLRSMRVVRTTAALDHFDAVTVRGGDVLPSAWPVGPVAIPHGLLSVFVNQDEQPAALVLTGNTGAAPK